MKALVTIASYGSKNQVFLQKLIREYKSMSYDVDIVVLSEAPKSLGPDIKLKVRLPTKDPWSLPFAHKKIFADRLKDYDLFIYSEDDMLIKERNIEAFLEVQEILPEDEIAGFLQYEERPALGGCSLSAPAIHSNYHWVSSSVKSIGKYTFAYLTNEHSACYILTQRQLAKAIASRGFLVPSHEGRYDLLCTAATDPYTQCGFNKVICISHIQDFLVHHLPNVYAEKLGLQFSELELQINALQSIVGNKEDQSELFPTRTAPNLGICGWDKQYFGRCNESILAAVSHDVRNVLSVGCGWGVTEAQLVQRGIRVVGIPLDLVIAESAKSRGIEVVCPNFDGAMKALKDECFDYILFDSVLHHLPDPCKVLTEYKALLREDGHMVATVPSFRYLRYAIELSKNKRLRGVRNEFDKTHLHFASLTAVNKWFSQSGLRVVNVNYAINDRFRRLASAFWGLLDQYFSLEVLFVVKKKS